MKSIFKNLSNLEEKKKKKKLWKGTIFFLVRRLIHRSKKNILLNFMDPMEVDIVLGSILLDSTNHIMVQVDFIEICL